MTTTWTIAVDWSRDGSYTDTNDDVSNYVVSAEWVLGMQRPYQDCADNSMLKLVLNNADKRFSPENGAGVLAGKILPYRPVRIQSNDGTTTRTHWVGWIDSIQPSVGKYGERLVHLFASGPLMLLKATDTKLALQQNVTTDVVIGQLITEVVIPPGLVQAWILGQAGYGELDQTTTLADTNGYSSLDTGNLTLPVAGDNWLVEPYYSAVEKVTYDVYQAIQEITSAEHGKFFFDRTGKAIFWNRHHLLQGESSVATFSDNMQELAYIYGDPDLLKNNVIVICHPRTYGANNTAVLWKIADGSSIQVPPGPYTMYINYQDATSTKRIGATNVTVTGLVSDTGTVTATIAPDANGAYITFNNSGTQAAYVTACIVQGKQISDLGTIDVPSSDEASMITYGRRTLRLNLPSIADTVNAQLIADFERIRRSQPQGTVSSLTLISHATQDSTLHAQQLARTIGDHITVTETQTGHSADYYIIGEDHVLMNSGMVLKTTWTLEPVPQTYPWKLDITGRSELGVSTVLTY